MVRRQVAAETDEGKRRIHRMRLLPLLIVSVGMIVYAGSFQGSFVFDDAVHILHNARIRNLDSLGNVLSGTRPVVDLTLAINYAAHRLRVPGYHAVNVTIHLLAALVLFGIVRRAYVRWADGVEPGAPGRAEPRRAAPWIALAASMIWLVHPLQTQSVTYLIQRAESLMGLFYLLTLYCVIRGADINDKGVTGKSWYAGAVACCALGMGCKAVMLSAPLVVFLFDWVFLSRSFVRTLRLRWGLYVALALTWSVLWMVGIAGGALRSTARGATLGFGYKGISPLDYALTQFGVLVEYLRLSVWPRPLCLDYTWPVATTVDSILLPAALVALLVVASICALWRRSWLGFLGAWFWLILAPTSSVIPIKDTMFEHRMYLPLAGVVVLAVIAAHYLLGVIAWRASFTHQRRRGVATALTVVLAGVLAIGTMRRNVDYRDVAGMWTDVTQKRPRNARAFDQLGTALLMRHDSGDDERAIEEYARAVELNPSFTSAHANLANILLQSGRPAEAERHYREVLRLDPRHVEAAMNLGHALKAQRRHDEALEAFAAAIKIEPTKRNRTLLARAFVNYGSEIGNRGDLDGAMAAYREATRLWPDYDNGHFWLGFLLVRRGEREEGIKHLRRVLEINPQHSRARQALDAALRG